MARNRVELLVLSSLALAACQQSYLTPGPPVSEGESASQVLNARYYNTDSACAAQKPIYFCSGVVAGVNGKAEAFWNPDHTGSRNTTSLIFLRRDAGRRAAMGDTASGYALSAADAWGQDGMLRLMVQCVTSQSDSASDNLAKECSSFLADDWPSDLPARFPVEAIFFLDGRRGLPAAQARRDAYLRATGITLPILRYTRDELVPPFSYHEDDQHP